MALKYATVDDPLPIWDIRFDLVVIFASCLGAVYCLLDRRPKAE